MIYRNSYWMTLLILIALSCLSYTGYACVKFYHYQQLSYSVPPQSIQWTIQQKDQDAFLVRADYQFIFQNQSYRNQTSFKEIYLNKWTAQEAIHRFIQQPPSVWINPSYPQSSSLQTDFPTKACLYAFMLWILLAYLLKLNRDVLCYVG